MLTFQLHSGATTSHFEFGRLTLTAKGEFWRGIEGGHLVIDVYTGHFRTQQPFPPLRHNGAPSSEGIARVGDSFTWDVLRLEVIAEVEGTPDFDDSVRAALKPDAESRAVLADWLETRGLVCTAEYTRLVAAPLTEASRARLAELAPHLWRYLREFVACAPIRRCTLTDRCPGRWERLPTGKAATMRQCPACTGYVRFATQVSDIPAAGPFVLEPAIAFQPQWERSGVIVGRPLLVDGVSHTAALTEPAPADDELVRTLRRAAEGEHAAIATFARTLCELMALGAPLELITRTQQALADELRHTTMTLAQLARLGDGAHAFGPLPEATASLHRSVGELMADVSLGAASERAAVDEARADAARCTDPQLREFFSTIADDEARHAQLAEDTVAWLAQQSRTSGGR